MPNQENVNKVADLKSKIKNAKSMIFAEYKGLKAAQADQFRAKMDEAGAKVEITKNTLFKVALKDAGIDAKNVEQKFDGTTLTIFSEKDPVAPFKAVFEFFKSANLPIVKLGFMDGKFFSADESKVLSELPSKEVLVARVLSGLNSPISGFVNALSGTKRNFVYTLKAIADKKQS